MGKQAQLFNGKRILLFVLGILVLLCAGVLIFHLLKKEKYDVSHTTLDEQVTLTLNDLADSEPWRNQGQVHYTAFTVEDIKDLSEKVKKSPYYIYTVDYKDKPESNIEEGYLFCKDGHYFYMTVEKDYVYLRDLVSSAYYYEYTHDSFFLPVIYHPADSNYFYFSDETQSYYFMWSETVGLKSFDDLKEYYSRIDSGTCDILSDKILIKEFHKFMHDPPEWTPEYALVITATETGFTIIVTDEHKEKTKKEAEVYK